MKVLIVDDSDAMRAIIKRTLRRQGWPLYIVEARDGKQAIQKFKTERPNLIITDWEMPTISGIQLIEAFKRNGLDVPIGMITGRANDENRRRALESGAAFVIGKPFTAKDIRECVRPFIDPSFQKVTAPTGRQPEGLIRELIAKFLNEMVSTSVWAEPGAGCPVTGSAGAVFVLGKDEDTPSHLMLMDWPLINYLDAAFHNLGAGAAAANIRQLRPTPAIHQTALELGNVFRGFLRRLENRQSLMVVNHAVRGDGTLRRPYWVELLSSDSLRSARHTAMTIHISGFGLGELSLYVTRDHSD